MNRQREMFEELNQWLNGKEWTLGDRAVVTLDYSLQIWVENKIPADKVRACLNNLVDQYEQHLKEQESNEQTD